MRAFVTKHRWFFLLFGAIIQIFTGIPAAWGVFQKPILDTFSLSQSFGSVLFALTVASFGIGCIPGGFLQDAKGPKAAGLSGVFLCCGGFLASAFIPVDAGWLLAFTFSLPIGCGCAFLYPAVMSCAQKWYADKKGLATGVIGASVGLSGAALTLLARFLQKSFGLKGCFVGFAVCFALFCGSACLLLFDPPQTKQPTAPKGPNYTPRQMLSSPQYKQLVAVVALGTPAVLLFSPIIVQWGQERGLSEGAAHLSIVIGSFGSAAGRLSMPALSDRFGRRRVDIGLFLALGLVSVLFAFANGWWVVAVYTLLTFCYSGECALLPAFSTDLFGLSHAGINYGFLALGQSAGSLLFTLLANSSNGTLFRHGLAVASSFAGATLLWQLKPTDGHNQRR